MTLSAEGQRLVEDVANRHGFGIEAVTQMLQAVANGYGTQAQFNHPEFGGMGQWSQGGMIMIGDMFNNSLKARVDALCNDLAREMSNRNVWAAPAASQRQSQGGQMQSNQAPGLQTQSQGGGAGGEVSLFVGGGAGGNWWPSELGNPSSTGAQNDLRYAYFPGSRRLAIALRGQVTVYDTGEHQISGVAQQQGGGASFTFTSQLGLVRVADLKVVSPQPNAECTAPQAAPQAAREPAPAAAPPAADAMKAPAEPAAVASAARGAPEDIFATLEKLANLQAKGVLSTDEFQAKKAELLSRL